MPGARGKSGSRRSPARPEAHVPAETGRGGVIDHTARPKPDAADMRGSAGVASGSVRASGTSPSIRAGAQRGLVLAGVGAGAGLALGIPRIFGGGSGGLLDVFTDDGSKPKDDDGDKGGDGSGLFDTFGEALGVNPGFLVLVTGAVVVLYFYNRKGGK